MRVNYTSRSEKVWRTVWITQNDFCLASKKVSGSIVRLFGRPTFGWQKFFHEFTLIYRMKSARRLHLDQQPLMPANEPDEGPGKWSQGTEKRAGCPGREAGERTIKNDKGLL
jgi:hypothetical protein